MTQQIKYFSWFMKSRNAQGHGQTVGQDTDITYRSRHDYKWHA